jgi:hypothetical protein
LQYQKVQYQKLELIIISSHWTPGQSLQLLLSTHSFLNTPNNRSLKLNSKDIPVSQMIIISWYVACKYDDHWHNARNPITLEETLWS